MANRTQREDRKGKIYYKPGRAASEPQRFRDGRGVLYEQAANGQIRRIEDNMQKNNNAGQVQIQVPVLLPLSENLYITPTLIQLICAMELLPIMEEVDYHGADSGTIDPNGRKTVGTLAAGAVRLKLTLASGAVIELVPEQADNFLTMIGARQKLVEVARSM